MQTFAVILRCLLFQESTDAIKSPGYVSLVVVFEVGLELWQAVFQDDLNPAEK